MPSGSRIDVDKLWLSRLSESHRAGSAPETAQASLLPVMKLSALALATVATFAFALDAGAGSVAIPCLSGMVHAERAGAWPLPSDYRKCISNCAQRIEIVFHEARTSTSSQLSIKINSIACIDSTGKPCAAPYAIFSTDTALGSRTFVKDEVGLTRIPCATFTISATCSNSPSPGLFESETVDLIVPSAPPHGTGCPQ